MTESRCSCGATLVRGALACSLCHAPVPVAAPVEALQAPAGPNGFLPAPPPSTQRNDQRVFSRVEAGPMSFGWTGRVVLTVLASLPIAFIWFMGGGGILNLILSLPVVVLPLWVMRESWRRSRVR
jgi:hypothetical protein